MATPPDLLNDDGSASMATMLMMSHHGFRRDLGRFARALTLPSVGERAALLRDEWQSFTNTLHGHHHAEDTGMFPSMQAQFPELAACIARLSADHAKIDPLVSEGDAAFSELPRTARASELVRELQTLLDPHLALEEEQIIPLIRGAKSFPPPGSSDEAELYARGFAWASHGVAADIREKVYAMLPDILRARLPAALRAFEERCERVWGPTPPAAARTPIPESLGH